MTAISSIPSVNWELKVNIDEFDLVEQSLRVTGDLHIGGVIIQLVEKLTPVIRNDWSDFSLWWPDKKQWLNKTKMTLDQYGVQADAILSFTRTHKYIQVQMPDLQVLDLNVDFSLNIFNLMKQVCKDLSIRHPEELSLLRPRAVSSNTNQKLEQRSLNNLKIDEDNKDRSANKSFSSSSNTSTLNNSSANSFKNLAKESSVKNDSSFMGQSKFIHERSRSFSVDHCGNYGMYGRSNNEQASLALSPVVLKQDQLNKFQYKFKTLFDRSHLNSR
jgi:hypothetical protein